MQWLVHWEGCHPNSCWIYRDLRFNDGYIDAYSVRNLKWKSTKIKNTRKFSFREMAYKIYILRWDGDAGKEWNANGILQR
jgi:hypothetical protein